MDTVDDLVEDTLFLACTRPAMFAGVTVEAMGVNVMVTTLLFLGLGSIRYALVSIVIHMVFRAILRTDHNAFRVLVGWAETKGRYRNSAHWGGSSVTPLRLGRTYDERDIFDD